MIVTKVCTRKQDRDTNLSRLSYLTCEAKNIRKRFCCSVLLFILTRIWIGYLSGNSDFLDDSIQLNGASMRRCWWQQQIQYFFHMCSSTPDEKSDLLFFWHEYEAYTSLIYFCILETMQIKFTCERMNLEILYKKSQGRTHKFAFVDKMLTPPSSK